MTDYNVNLNKLTSKELTDKYNVLDNVKPVKVGSLPKTELIKRIELARQIEATSESPKQDDSVTIATLSRELDKNPKVVRARLRRLYSKDPDQYPQPVNEGKWVFHSKDKDEMTRLISS